MLALAASGVIAAIAGAGYLMLGVVLLSFIPVGFYLLLTPGVFTFIGASNTLYLFASLQILRHSRLSRPSNRGTEGRTTGGTLRSVPGCGEEGCSTTS
jgi:hypothetical protein